MVKLEITPNSSPAELAEASRQYKAAQSEYTAWKSTLVQRDYTYPATATLPAETVKVPFDPQKGQFLLGMTAYDAKKAEIAAKYSYLTTVSPSSTSVDNLNVGSNAIQINGSSPKLAETLANTPSPNAYVGGTTIPPTVETDTPVTEVAEISGPGNGAGGGAGDGNEVIEGPGTGGGQPGTGNLTDDAVGDGGTGATSGASSNKPAPIKQRPNVLHDYANWTYQVGWYMLDRDSFNQFVETGKEPGNFRKYPIFKSGGIRETGSNNGIDFDLGLRSLRMTGIIGNNKYSPNANQYEIEMEIIEPYGVSLLPKLRVLAQSLQGENKEFQIPYLLEIKWVGYDDNNKLVNNIPNSGPKLIAVQIINVSFNITSSGTIYKITFAPSAQFALGNILGIVRTDTRVYGGTFEEVIKGNSESLKAKLNAMGENDVKNKRAEYADTYDFEIVSYSDDARTPDDRLAKSSMMYPVVGGESTVEALKRYDTTKQEWTFSSGSSVKAIISDLARNSKYFYDKIVDLETADEVSLGNLTGSDQSLPQQDQLEKKLAAMELIKVVPVITLGSYDKIRGVYQKNIVYKVIPFYLYGQINARTGQAPVSNRGYVKEYNWLFTGKNQDVIDINLTYDVLYFRLFQTTVGAKAVTDTASNAIGSDGLQPALSPDAASQPRVWGDINARTNKGDKPNAVQEYFEQQLNPSYGTDLVQLDLSIIGDPDWIPQDRSIRPVGTSTDANNNGYVDGELAKGISVDVDGVYVNINFRTPADYSDKTGLMNLGSDESALIAGYYQVITVESLFQDGRFTQILNMVRVPSQEKNVVKQTADYKTQLPIYASASPPALPPTQVPVYPSAEPPQPTQLPIYPSAEPLNKTNNPIMGSWASGDASSLQDDATGN